MVSNAFGDVGIVKVNYIYNTFGKGACMDSYLMFFVIKYWKQDPEMSLVYRSGKRVLLAPLFITVNVSAVMFFLLWCIFFSCIEFFMSMRACMFYSFFHVLFLFFFYAVCS